MDVLTCDVCGSSFSARYERDEPEPERNWSAALALSAVLPGAGHISVGRIGTGIARCTLFVVFLLPALPIMFGAKTGGATIAITPLLIGVLILWGGSIADIRQLQRGDKEILNGRALLWLTVGVLLLSLVGLAAAVMMARGQSG
ncbi:MAG TPA: hypothetical protein VML96_11920 [Egibacteraceae bacterium]|nr:hypothetical protein [Egibacteraceae bacterium]